MPQLPIFLPDFETAISVRTLVMCFSASINKTHKDASPLSPPFGTSRRSFAVASTRLQRAAVSVTALQKEMLCGFKAHQNWSMSSAQLQPYPHIMGQAVEVVV